MSDKIVAIVPARGGSKRIPKKNIKSFAGKPIIAYPIKCAREAGLFDRIVVSTDSQEIAQVAREWGAEVPFVRPAELSNDFADTSAVILHTLNWLKGYDALPEYFCCIYATAPFLQAESLKQGLNRLRQTEAITAFSVASFAYPIFRALKTDEEGYLKMFWSKHKNTRSNDLPKAYHDAGQFYWAHTQRFLKEETFFSSKAVPVVLPRHLVQDIDTPEDWVVAEHMYKALILDKNNSAIKQKLL
jgi:pseudaminic acid cytidylyltransferase